MDKKKRERQLKRVYKAFYNSPKTMKEADKATGVMRENICWYCRELRKSNKLYLVGRRLCSITKHEANVYTTNPALVPAKAQLELFEL